MTRNAELPRHTNWCKMGEILLARQASSSQARTLCEHHRSKRTIVRPFATPGEWPQEQDWHQLAQMRRHFGSCRILFFLVVLHPGKTANHAPQKMENSGIIRRVVEIVRGPRFPAAKSPGSVHTRAEAKHDRCASTATSATSDQMQDNPPKLG